jgi:hypothetical protein
MAPEVRERFVSFSDRFANLFVVESEMRPTAGANCLVMVPKPTEAHIVLMSAMRAGKLDLALLDLGFRHGIGSSNTAHFVQTLPGARTHHDHSRSPLSF